VDGPARAACEETIARLKIGAICTVAGMMSNSEVRDRMQQCDALVLASRSESFGMVLIEAMSCGKPVIATRCGGPEEIVTAETGILVAVDDPHALADGIVRMAQTLHTFDPQRIAAYAAHHFGPQAVVQQLEQVYTEAITVSVQQNLNP
jgi:glycosyltransferase involved in cell wall biosynthesis